MKTPYTFYFVVPCYNEEAVLPVTAPQFIAKLEALHAAGRITADSRVLFVDDGSRDTTWEVISALSAEHTWVEGARLTRNRGHQNALLAGLMTAKERAHVTVSIDCDGQDDIHAVDKMLDEYEGGCDVVYGVRADRSSDTAFKRGTARAFYRLQNRLGVESVYDHADYRLMSRRALEGLSQFEEVNLYLRGMVPLVGYRSTSVYYTRTPRVAGESHYPLRKMLALAVNGITSLSVKPIRMVFFAGLFIMLLSFIGIIWAFIAAFMGKSVAGWASLACIVCFMGGVQCLFLGVIGEYIGKIYLEVKGRPRYIISDRTGEQDDVRS